MNTITYPPKGYILALLTMFIVVVFSFSICTAQERIQAVWPLTEAIEMDISALANEVPEPYIEKYGYVRFAADRFFPKAAETGIRTATEHSFRHDAISIALFPEKQYDIQVTGETRPKQDVIALNGRIADHTISTFSLTITQDFFLISLQDLNSGMVYRVSGDMHTGIGQVRQINPAKMPPITYSPPLIPPSN